jgi:hypothetical protein
MRDRLVELLEQKMHPYLADDIADYLIENGATVIPCKVSDTVYKICPKCNPNHNGSCKHCAWSGCHPAGCDVGVRVYSDGSFNEKEKQIVPYVVTANRLMTILKYWNVMFFATPEEAEKAKDEYVEICKTKDSDDRHYKYLEWESSREIHWNFLEEE